MSMIHSVERKLCFCGAVMLAEINRHELNYFCAYGHTKHPPERFRDKANGE